jgi:hypothetical protein
VEAQGSRRRIAGIALGVLVILGLGSLGAIALLRGPGSKAPGSTQPSSTPTPVAPGRIGVYAFAAGTQNVSNPGHVIAELRSASFRPDGIDWVIGWRLIEPSAGVYDWSLVDNDLAAATAAGFGSFVEIIPGEDTPAWALAECPTVQLTLQNSTAPVTMCVPTSVQFLSLWTQMIAAFGLRYHGRPGLTMVQATGCGVQGEMQLPDHSAAFWSQYGLTSQTLLAAWEQVIGAWRRALPDIPSSLAIEEPLGNGNSDVLHPLLSYVHEHFGADVWVQQNGLRQGTQTSPGSYGGDLATAAGWTRVGWQMYGAGTANGDLATALTDGLAVHPSFYEVYLSDILDASSEPPLNSLRAGA